MHTLDKNVILRYDFLFSYWLFTWFLLYWFLPNYNTLRTLAHPAVALLVGIAENLITLILIFIYNPRWEIIWKFVAMMACIKIAPFYLVVNAPYPPTIPWRQSTIAFCIVFALYLGYLSVNRASFAEIYKTAIVSVVEDRNQTPLYATLSRMHTALGITFV